MKHYLNYLLQKGKNSKLYLSLLNNYFLIVIGIVIILLGIKHHIYWLFLPLLVYYLGKNAKSCLFVLIIIGSVTLIHYQLFLNKPTFRNEEIIGIIKDINENKITITNKSNKVLVYYDGEIKVAVGMKVFVKGKLLTIDPNRIEHGFNYQEYLKYHHYDGALEADRVSILGETFCFEIIKAKVNDYFNANFRGETLVFMKALVLGDDSLFTDEFNESLKINGIIHLFAISGSHITLFVGVISYILTKCKIKESKQIIIIITFLGFYLIITSFSPSIFRAALMYLLAVFSQKLKLRFSALDVGSIVFLGLIMVNPFYIYDIGFVLSFIVSFLIILVSPLIKGGVTKQTFIISSLAQVITLPFIININYEINLLSPITNVIYIFMVESVIIPFSVILVFLPLLQFLYRYMVMAFSESSAIFSEYFSLNLRMPYLSPYIIIIYYLLVYFIIHFFYQKKLRSLLIVILIMFCLVLTSGKVNAGEINFLDLYNGEAIVITDRCGKCNAVIDTGDGKNNEVTNFLKSKGITKLHYLILTHNHEDHNGEAWNIINQFQVNKIVVGAYDNNELGNLSNAIRVKENDVLICGDIKFMILHPDKAYANENDNSIVIYSKIGKHRFLFMGDISTNVEMKFAYLNIDVIKIGHHGSSTSTSLAFLQKLKPKIAIIQTGRVKKFGFPYQEVIDNLQRQKIIIYRTDLNYSIKYKYNKKRGIFIPLK